MYSAQMYRILKTRSAKLIVLIVIIASAVVALLPHYHSFDEIMTGLGETAQVFSLFAAVMIATRESGRGTLNSIVSSGMKRSSIYYAKLKVVIVSSIFFYVIESIVTLLIGILIFNYPITMGIAGIIGNILYHLLIVILSAMLYYAAASFLSDPVWSVMACLAYLMFAAQALADLTTRLGLPLDLSSFVLGGISHYDIMKIGAMQGVGIVVNLFIVFIIVLLVPVFIRKRNLG